MSLSIYSKASTDSLLLAKASLSGATFTGTVTAPNFTITAGSGGVLTFADGTTQSTAASGGGGGATWGSITGSISSQTDLQTEFGNYLPLAGGTLTGGLTVASAGITFSDASVQTSAAVAFTGGAISSPITYGNMTTDSYFGADLIGIELTGTSQNTTMQYSGLQVTDGSQTASFTLSGITFADTTTMTTAPNLSLYLPLSGGAMSGGLTLGGNMNADGYEINNCNFNSPAGQVNCQNLTLTAGDSGVITFQDGSVQSTAATSGYTALQATTDAIANCFTINSSTGNFVLVGNAGCGCQYGGKFQSGSSYLIGIGSPSPIYFTAGFDANGYAIGYTTATFSPTAIYLYYSQDGGSTWTQSSFTIA